MGAGKRAMLSRVEAGASPDEVPIAGLKPVAGELRWYLDAAACL
jgi:6-phosphogluconolactonase/glucosamine-6-phosphate isomerase/deaminase